VGTIGPANGKYNGAGKLASLAVPFLHGKRSKGSQDGSLPNWFTSAVNMETLYQARAAAFTVRPQNGVSIVHHNT
jgi:hypothetical protein